MKNICLSFALLFSLIGCATSKKEITPPTQTEVVEIQKSEEVKKVTKEITKKVSSPKLNTTASETSCRSGADTRVLTIIPIETTGCELQYTKNGEAKTVANANFNPDYCSTVKDRIQKKLEIAGFDCK